MSGYLFDAEKRRAVSMALIGVFVRIVCKGV